MLRDTLVIFWKEAKSYLRWKEWIVGDILGSLLWFVGFIIVWSAILAGGFEGVGGLTRENYIPFLLSGALLTEILSATLGHASSHTFLDEKRHRTIQNLLLSPLKTFSIPSGKIIIPLIRSGLMNLVIIMFALSFFDFTIKGNLFTVLLIYILSFLGFFGIGLILASLSLWREAIGDLSWIISQGLNVFSATMYPVEILPEPIKSISLSLPSTQAVISTRAVVLQGAGFFDISGSILYLFVFAVASLLIASLSFNQAQKKAMLIGI
jgi:ABC-2 type transport system permease protein